MKRLFIYAAIACLLTLFYNKTIAQDSLHLIEGKISDAKGNPIAGATVSTTLSHTHTITSNEGTFKLNAQYGDSVLIQAVSFVSQTVAVNAQTFISITLQSRSDNLEDVVVIGYQTVQRKDLTGATGVVNMGNASKLSAGTVGESMQGLVPGVTVRNGGAPGQNSVIEIRGTSNFSGGNPLYVIDGMLSDANVTINPDDIATVQILKDASASAIYGSRAGNGVVIITTKRGKVSPPVISFISKYGRQQLPKTWDVMNAHDYLQTTQQQYDNSGVPLPKDVADQLKNNTINTDWQKAVYRTSNYQDYYLGISGGSATANYNIAGGYYKNDGTVIGNTFNRASLRINSEIKKGILTFGENMMLSSSNNNFPGGGVNVFYNAAQMLPIIKVQSDEYKDPTQYPSNPAGWGLGSSNDPTYANNYNAAAAMDKVSNSYGKLLGNAYISLKLTDWLSYKFNAGLEVSYDYTKEVRDTGIWRYTNQPTQTFASEGRSRFTNLLLEHTLNFNKTFGLHTINGVIGFSRTQQQRDFTNASRNVLQYLNGILYSTIGSAIGDPSADGGLANKWRSHGWLGRINYGYNDKYLLTLTGRIDQDSRFGTNYRTGYFPSIAGAWRISKEDFFKVSWINDLKIRASYGRLGYSDELSAWEYLGLLNSASRAIYGTSETPQLGQYQAALNNPDIHWEKRQQTDVGMDASLFDNSLSVSLDWYNSVSKDVLLQLPLPNYLGSSATPFVNTGSIKNSGIEFSATYKNNSHRIKWDISGNFTTINNKVLSVGDQGADPSGNKIDYLEPANFSRTVVGHKMASWFVIQTDGLFQSQEEVDNYKNSSGKIIQPNAKPGDVKYIDLNDDGQITDNDRTLRGSPWPTLQAGLQFNGSYKSFNLNVQFIGIFGNKIYDDVRRALDNYQLTNFRSDIDPWTPDNKNASDPRLDIDNGNDPSVSANNMAQTDRWLENGSYVRLRNIELGYNFSPDWLKKASINSLRLYISGQNLFTITKYNGLDPDVANGNPELRGFDSGFWPSSRIYSIGLNLEF